MTKEELIAKQQLEIENLRLKITEIEDIAKNALNELTIAEQRSVKCPDFSKVAMRSICNAGEHIRCILDSHNSIT